MPKIVACLPTDAAWAAGFLDGEGAFVINHQIYNGRQSWSAYIEAVNTSKAPLERLQGMFGGTLRAKTLSKRSGNENWKQPYVWHCNRGGLEDVLRTLLPYLVVKRMQAELILMFLGLLLVKNSGAMPDGQNLDNRHMLKAMMTVLNTRGVERSA